MEEEILTVLKEYADSIGKSVSDRVVADIHCRVPSFVRICDSYGYTVNPFVNDEGTLIVQFVANDHVYVNYSFPRILLR